MSGVGCNVMDVFVLLSTQEYDINQRIPGNMRGSCWDFPVLLYSIASFPLKMRVPCYQLIIDHIDLFFDSSVDMHTRLHVYLSSIPAGLTFGTCGQDGHYQTYQIYQT